MSVHSCLSCPALHRSIFSGVNTDELLQMDLTREVRTFGPGEELPLKSETECGFYCIQKGCVKVSMDDGGKTVPVRLCGPGDVIGYDVLMTGVKRHLTSVDTVTACYFKMDPFVAAQKKFPSLCGSVTKMLCHKLRQSEEDVAGLGNISVKTRVASLLDRLNKKFGVIESDGSRIDLAVDRRTMAKLAGTVVESFARALTELEDDKVIRRHGRAIKVVDPVRLKEYAHG